MAFPEESPFQSSFASHLDSWYPQYHWIKSGSLPHVKTCLYLNTEGANGGVFREELLTIIATILSRMYQESLQKYPVIPVCPIALL